MTPQPGSLLCRNADPRKAVFVDRSITSFPRCTAIHPLISHVPGLMEDNLWALASLDSLTRFFANCIVCFSLLSCHQSGNWVEDKSCGHSTRLCQTGPMPDSISDYIENYETRNQAHVRKCSSMEAWVMGASSQAGQRQVVCCHQVGSKGHGSNSISTPFCLDLGRYLLRPRPSTFLTIFETCRTMGCVI